MRTDARWERNAQKEIDFPIMKGVLCLVVFLNVLQVRFVSVTSIVILCKIGKTRPSGESSKPDKLESEEERRKSEPRAACNKTAWKNLWLKRVL